MMDTVLERLKQIITEQYEFEDRDKSKKLALLNIWTLNILNQRIKPLTFYWITPRKS